MNNTVIDIQGIKVLDSVINLQDSTDKAHVLTIKDEHGSEVKVEITFGKITNSTWKK